MAQVSRSALNEAAIKIDILVSRWLEKKNLPTHGDLGKELFIQAIADNLDLSLNGKITT